MSSDPTSLFSSESTEPATRPAPALALPPLPVPVYPSTAGSGAALPKSPGLATFLSLFPGVGQIYNGQPAKGFAFFFGIVGAIWGAADIHPMPFALLIPFIYFFNLVDAYRSAHAINLGGSAATLLEEEAFESPAWGVGLVALGTLLLLKNLGWLDLDLIRRWWPVALIALGGYFIRASIQRKD